MPDPDLFAPPGESEADRVARLERLRLDAESYRAACAASPAPTRAELAIEIAEHPERAMLLLATRIQGGMVAPEVPVVHRAPGHA